MRGNFVTDKHGSSNPNYKDGRKGTRLYRIYNNMKTRCYNVNSPSYKYYGARGIKICSDWLVDYLSFYSWAITNGYADNLTIERKNVNGDYTPENCVWATYKTQANNTRSNIFVTLDGVRKTLTEWSALYGINVKTVKDRLRRGWDIESALKTPLNTTYGKRVML